MAEFDFSTTKTLICAPGSSSRLSELCKALDISNLMLVTDKGLLDAGIIQPIVSQLETNKIKPLIFSDVIADPPEEVVIAAASRAKENRIDGVLGLGGGSSMDVAKLIAVLAKGGVAIENCYGIDQISSDRLPLILVPTTAGTGSEVTPISIVTTGKTTKTGVVSSRLLPDYAVLDAELTLNLPAQVTAATGVDAMVHAIEAFTSKIKKNFYSDMLAKQALSLLSQNIGTAVKDGKNIKARQNMLLGSALAGQAFANAPVAAVHALAYPLGGHFHIPHGLSNALVLLPVLRINSHVVFEQYSELLECFDSGCEDQTSVSRAETFIDEMERIIDDVELPRKLSDLDIGEQDLPLLARDAMLQQRLLVNNPVDIQEKDALAIYQSVF